MKTLYLNIGHGKTSSTYLQHLLALNKDILLNNKIEYPIKSEIYHKALNGDVTSGNGDDLLRALRTGEDDLWDQALKNNNDYSRLFSNELFHSALSQRTLGILAPKALSNGWEKIKILLFIRDPIEHAISCYIQTLKRSRNRPSGYINSFVERYRVPLKTLSIIKACQSLNNCISIQIYNYTKVKQSISDKLFNWLGIQLESLELTANQSTSLGIDSRINRSLTLAEQEFCKALIDAGIPSKFLSDALVTQLPRQQAEQPKVGRRSVEAMLEANKAAMDQINHLVGQSSGYSEDELAVLSSLDLLEDEVIQPTNQSFSLTREQVRVITQSLVCYSAPKPTLPSTLNPK